MKRRFSRRTSTQGRLCIHKLGHIPLTSTRNHVAQQPAFAPADKQLRARGNMWGRRESVCTTVSSYFFSFAGSRQDHRLSLPCSRIRGVVLHAAVCGAVLSPSLCCVSTWVCYSACSKRCSARPVGGRVGVCGHFPVHSPLLDFMLLVVAHQYCAAPWRWVPFLVSYPCACAKQTSVQHHSPPMYHLRLFFVCLCQACTAFVFFPATTRLPLSHFQRSVVVRSCAPAAATARPLSAAPRERTARPIGWRRLLPSSSIGGVTEGNVAVRAAAAGATPEDDPFRPERASVSPMVINAIVAVLFKHVRRGPSTDCIIVSLHWLMYAQVKGCTTFVRVSWW